MMYHPNNPSPPNPATMLRSTRGYEYGIARQLSDHYVHKDSMMGTRCEIDNIIIRVLLDAGLTVHQDGQ